MKEEEYICSFCGRSSREVTIIPGADGNICIDCVRHANEMVTVSYTHLTLPTKA